MSKGESESTSKEYEERCESNTRKVRINYIKKELSLRVKGEDSELSREDSELSREV